MKPTSQYILTTKVTPIHTDVVLDNPSGSPRFTNLEFRSTLEQFLIADGDCHVVVIGHVNCYGIQRARLVSTWSRDSAGGQMCFIDDWLASVVELFPQDIDAVVSDKEISILNIQAQVEELEKTIMKEEERWGTQGVVTITGLLFDDTAPGMQTTQLIVREVPRREEEA